MADVGQIAEGKIRLKRKHAFAWIYKKVDFVLIFSFFNFSLESAQIASFCYGTTWTSKTEAIFYAPFWIDETQQGILASLLRTIQRLWSGGNEYFRRRQKKYFLAIVGMEVIGE